MTVPSQTSWLMIPKPAGQPRLRLFCFPHAGGGASLYQSWADGLAPGIELCAVQLPGRETRLSERPMTDLRQLGGALVTALRPYLDVPFACFGHSMGALVAFEFARQLRQSRGPMPAHLFVSGRPAPHIFHEDRSIRALPDADFVREVAYRYSGIPAEVLAHAELMELITPLLRADITMVETYRFVPEDTFRVPISALGGLADTTVDFEELEAWREHTSAGFRIELLPGDHFYLHANRAMLLASIMRDLYPVLRPEAVAAGA